MPRNPASTRRIASALAGCVIGACRGMLASAIGVRETCDHGDRYRARGRGGSRTAPARPS